MGYIDWRIKGREFGNCNCAYGCPCQFNALPTHGNCHATVGYLIDEGHFGDVKLDELCAVFIASWPGAIHEGDGTSLIVIDERADAAQREALTRILKGEETEPFATMWNVFRSTMAMVHDPIFRPIEFEVDVEARTARLAVPGLVDTVGEPIRNPVTGDPHRARIDLPHGFEYAIAEMGSGRSNTLGPIPMELKDTYGQFAHIHLTQNGVVR